jgi:type VI secretion system secreted protein Hcp
MAAVDYYLKITCANAGDITGESQADGHTGEIDIMSWSWGQVNSASGRGLAGQGAGRVDMQDMHFTALHCSASAPLALACATGDAVKTAVLSCRKAGGGQQDFLTYTLEDGLISSYQSGGSQGDVIPVDQFSINFSKITHEYKKQDPDSGSMSTAGNWSYDLRTVKAG